VLLELNHQGKAALDRLWLFGREQGNRLSKSRKRPGKPDQNERGCDTKKSMRICNLAWRLSRETRGALQIHCSW